MLGGAEAALDGGNLDDQPPQRRAYVMEASAAEADDSYDYDGGGEQMTPAMRADAARAGELDFVGVLGPHEGGEHGWHENFQGSGHSFDSYAFGYEREGYHLEHGYGSEASRPPDFGDPEDTAAYPFGVIYEDDPRYEQLFPGGNDQDGSDYGDDSSTGGDHCDQDEDGGYHDDGPELEADGCDLEGPWS